MTANRDLKRRVRDRQAQTGEAYMTALRHVLAQRPGGIASAIPTIEFIDVTEIAAGLGLKCRISVSPALAHAIDVERTLERFCEALAASSREPALLPMQTIALHGEHVHFPQTPGSGFHELHAAAQFLERVLIGIGELGDSAMPGLRVPDLPGARRSADDLLAGLARVSDSGRMLALRAVPRAAAGAARPASDDAQPEADDDPIAVFSPWSVPTLATVTRPPLLIVNALDEVMPPEILERFRTVAP